MDFWAGRNLLMGVVDGDPIFTLMPEYKYVYNATNKTADYYDESGNSFYHRDNVQSVADLHIDYTIHKSHQFEIHILVYAGSNLIRDRDTRKFKDWYDPNY